MSYIKPKRMTNSLLWLIIHWYSIKRVLKNKFKINNIKIYKFINWNLGRAYFTGYYNNQKVFIKIYSKFMVLKNELIFYSLFKNKLDLINVLDFFSNNKMQVIIYEYVEGRHLSDNDIIKTPELLLEIFKILLTINKDGFIHRDIRKENILITNKGLRIIDFSFIINFNKNDNTFLDIAQNKKSLRLLKFLGDKLNPKDFEWNDFYSLNKIIDNLLSNNKIDATPLRKIKKYKILFENRIKNNTYQLQSCRE